MTGFVVQGHIFLNKLILLFSKDALNWSKSQNLNLILKSYL